MKIFVLTDKRKEKPLYYTTLAALCEENGSEIIGVSKYTLDRIDFSCDIYENEYCKIETSPLKTRGDIIRQRNQFL